MLGRFLRLTPPRFKELGEDAFDFLSTSNDGSIIHAKLRLAALTKLLFSWIQKLDICKEVVLILGYLDLLFFIDSIL